jgi:hypothetical protein
LGIDLRKQAVLGLLLVVALLAFEIFNFDTTRFALRDLLGAVSFLSVEWASILAIAFCAIDFAGLAHLLTPQRDRSQPREAWYLMGAWLLGATMNAIMTWWAVSVTLLSHNLGNEVLTREQLLTGVPLFVAVLVWLTRILFIGAFSVAGDHFFNSALVGQRAPLAAKQAMPARRPQPIAAERRATQPLPHLSDEAPAFLTRRSAGVVIERVADDEEPIEMVTPNPPLRPSINLGSTVTPEPARRSGQSERLRHRPPTPGVVRTVPLGAEPRSRR